MVTSSPLIRHKSKLSALMSHEKIPFGPVGITSYYHSLSVSFSALPSLKYCTISEHTNSEQCHWVFQANSLWLNLFHQIHRIQCGESFTDEGSAQFDGQCEDQGSGADVCLCLLKD